MADFKTHMIGAALVSGVAATGLAMVSSFNISSILGFFSLGVVGGLLPDIDSESSIPIRISFNILSVIVAFLLVFHFSNAYSLLELVILGITSFILVRYGIFKLFTHFTVHRGLIHSIPAAIIAATVTSIIAYELLNVTPVHAWIWGIFIFGGFMVHLILDELYSVDLMGAKFKRSFGTAVCMGSWSNPIGTVLLYVVMIALLFISPPYQAFLNGLFNDLAYQELLSRLLPQGVWFRGLFNNLI